MDDSDPMLPGHDLASQPARAARIVVGVVILAGLAWSLSHAWADDSVVVGEIASPPSGPLVTWAGWIAAALGGSFALAGGWYGLRTNRRREAEIDAAPMTELRAELSEVRAAVLPMRGAALDDRVSVLEGAVRDIAAQNAAIRTELALIRADGGRILEALTGGRTRE